MGCGGSRTPGQVVNEYHTRKGGRLANALAAGTIAVIKSEYFQDCLKKGQPFAKRNDIPKEALWAPKEIAERWYKMGRKCLVIFSYSWLSQSHPDPDLFHLPAIVRVIDAMGALDIIYPGVIIDYCSFYQQPRTPEQEDCFKECLGLVNLPYGHPDVTAAKLTGVPPGELRTYDRRGWTKFESDIISAKPPAPGDILGLWNVLTLDRSSPGWDADRPDLEKLALNRRSPMVTPERFEQQLLERQELAEHAGVRLFTSGKDQPFIVKKYEEAFVEIAKNIRTLDYTDMRFEAAEARLLAESLPHLTNVRVLQLDGNKVGAEGAACLFKNNNIGAEGAACLAEALPHLTKLRALSLSGNYIGAEGAACLFKELPHLTKLRQMFLDRNDLGAEGAACLAEALPHLTSLGSIYMSQNNLGEEGKACLEKAKLSSLGICYRT